MDGAEIITIGSELLYPWSAESNSAFMTQILFSLGIPLRFKSVVGDTKEEIALAIRSALQRARWILLSGGLGPTRDDVTREAVSEATGKPLILDKEVLSGIRNKMIARGRRFLKIQERQAWFPEESIRIVNSIGIADGFIVSAGSADVVALPGVPSEMRAMMPELSRFILKNQGKPKGLFYKNYRTFGISESVLNEKISDLPASREVEIGLLAKGTGAELTILVKNDNPDIGRDRLRELDRKIKSRLKKWIYSDTGETLESIVGRELRKKKMTLAVAESCTGGLVTHRLTNVPGSSDYVHFSAVTYSNQSKIDQLGVSPQLIRRFGAVSSKVALAMAEGIRKVSQSDCGIAITGIAGPGGGTAKKPVGLVYFGISDRHGASWEKARYSVDRETFKWFASSKALDMVRHRLAAS